MIVLGSDHLLRQAAHLASKPPLFSAPGFFSFLPRQFMHICNYFNYRKYLNKLKICKVLHKYSRLRVDLKTGALSVQIMPYANLRTIAITCTIRNN